MWKRLYLECTCENRKYLASIIDDLAIPCDKIIEETKAFKTNFDKKIDCKIQNVFVLIPFLLITIGLLISDSVYCYLIKYWAKEKHLLPFHDTNNKFKMFYVNNILKKHGK